MNDPVNWLPPLVSLQDYDGDWDRYVAAVYWRFYEDFVRTRPKFEGIQCKIDSRLEPDGREATFWHLVSEGQRESERTPDIRRFERVCWLRPMIDAVPGACVKWWRNRRGREERIVIALADFSYVVVLAVRKNYFLLWTAYCVELEHRRRKLEREYNNMVKN